MVNQWRLGCNVCLVCSVGYGFISGAIAKGKNFGIASLVVYGVSGVVVIITELTNRDHRLWKIDRYMQALKCYSALDLLTAEVLISIGQVEMKWALLTLIPSVLDICFYIATKDWNDLTPWWHIVDIVIFIVFAAQDNKFILIPGAIAYMFAIFGTDNSNNTNNNKEWVALFEAIGLFCVAACIGGKDLKDFGVPIGN